VSVVVFLMHDLGFNGVAWVCVEVVPTLKLTPTPDFQFETVEPSPASASLILRMAVAGSTETLDQLHHMMRLNR
jgi:hypothetical protein